MPIAIRDGSDLAIQAADYVARERTHVKVERCHRTDGAECAWVVEQAVEHGTPPVAAHRSVDGSHPPSHTQEGSEVACDLGKRLAKAPARTVELAADVAP